RGQPIPCESRGCRDSPLCYLCVLCDSVVSSILRSTGDANQPTFSLAAAAYVHDSALFVESQMEAFASLDAVQRKVIVAAAGGEVAQFVRRLRRAQPAPRAVAQIKHAVVVRQAAYQRFGPLECVIVMFQDDWEAIFLEQRHPMLAVVLARALLAVGRLRI